MAHTPSEVLQQLQAELGVDYAHPLFAQTLDDRDNLRSFRQRFLIPQAKDFGAEQTGDAIYLCGNSLGLQPVTTQQYVQEELQEWATRGVEGHFNHSKGRPWLNTDEFVLEQTCTLVGAHKDEVAIMNSLTVNLNLMMVPFYRPTKDRHKILIEAKAFPSDLVLTGEDLW